MPLCLAVALPLLKWSGSFAAPPGLSRKQVRGTLHNRDQLQPPFEVPLEEPAEELPPKEPLPERRVPYSLHIVSHFPQHKHLHEESTARTYIEEKIVESFENFEDMIKHVEVKLEVSEHFHKDKPVHHKLHMNGDVEAEIGDSSKTLAPYIFKVTVSLKNHRSVVLANAEKHAQPTLTEGLDHMVDVIKKSLREEKEREMKARIKAKNDADFSDSLAMDQEEAAEADAIAEALEAEADEKRKALYEKIEKGMA